MPSESILHLGPSLRYGSLEIRRFQGLGSNPQCSEWIGPLAVSNCHTYGFELSRMDLLCRTVHQILEIG
jgi:hypothetical protein